jgi:transcriptional regulator with XRE-family HTH domain
MIAIDEQVLAQQVGRCLRQARRARKWKQARVAEAVGISAPFYGRIERGTALPSMDTFARLLTLFGLSPSVVLGFVPPTAEAAGDAPVLRRIARRLRRAPARGHALVREILDELDRRRQGRD